MFLQKDNKNYIDESRKQLGSRKMPTKRTFTSEMIEKETDGIS